MKGPWVGRSKVVIGYLPGTNWHATVVMPEETDPPDFDELRVPMHVANLESMGEIAIVVDMLEYHEFSHTHGSHGPVRLLEKYLRRTIASGVLS